MKVAIFDLDSTLAHTAHRRHIIDPEDWSRTDWVAYAMASGEDTPFPATVALARLLHSLGVCVWILSGRTGPPEVEAITRQWLETHGIPFDFLTLRPPSEGASNGDFKRQQIDRFREIYADAEFVLALDDWPAVEGALADVCPTLLFNPNYPDPEHELARETTRDDSISA